MLVFIIFLNEYTFIVSNIYISLFFNYIININLFILFYFFNKEIYSFKVIFFN
jgi:hypothetical protein